MTDLPAWLEPLPDAELMRATDAWAVEQRGIPPLELMERAGSGLADEVARRAPDGRVVVVCGGGNNGGDGLVAARLLRERGREVGVLCTASPDDLRGDARANLERLPGPPAQPFAPGALADAAVAVDAVLGTGFSGGPREPAAAAIEAMNAAGAPVVCADVPSGVDASTGRVEGAAVRAQATVTFHAAKPGLHIAPGKRFAGAVSVVDIGIPGGAPGKAQIGLILPRILDEIPSRHAGSTKFSEGAVAVVGGSGGLTGAPRMASEAATRAGAGYVTALVPASQQLVFELALLEAMTRGLPDADGAMTPDALGPALSALERVDAVVVGPGIGRAEGTVELARALAAQAPVPLLLDADGLNAHAGRLKELAGRDEATVLTPHAGELARLLETDSETVESARLDHVRWAAEAAGAVVVLKGDDTLVARPGGPVAVSSGGSPALATAGTGDVLSGVIGAMLAKGLPAFTAACAGVCLHAAAGAQAARTRSPDAVIARDVIEALAIVRRRADDR